MPRSPLIARTVPALRRSLDNKISREDILAHAYAQCRSNKGAPGVDGQDFADIEAYGVQRWLGENLRKRKATVALVPTMGALHDGYVSLVRLA